MAYPDRELHKSIRCSKWPMLIKLPQTIGGKSLYNPCLYRFTFMLTFRRPEIVTFLHWTCAYQSICPSIELIPAPFKKFLKVIYLHGIWRNYLNGTLLLRYIYTCISLTRQSCSIDYITFHIKQHCHIISFEHYAYRTAINALHLVVYYI